MPPIWVATGRSAATSEAVRPKLGVPVPLQWVFLIWSDCHMIVVAGKAWSVD
jgi:hypothetical protein